MNNVFRLISFVKPFLINNSSRSYPSILSEFYSTNMSELKEKFSAKCFGGYQKIFAHDSKETNCEMRFAVYLPPQATSENKLPVIYFLSGLSMDYQTFIDKSGAQRYAAEQGVVLVAPDSSPHGANIPSEKGKWYYGNKASHYIDATEEPWSKHYKMYSYLTKELPDIVNKNFPVLPDKRSIIGHSIGGYAAFLLSLRNPKMFVSTSALAPVCDPCSARYSTEALERYLGKDRSKWEEWNAVHRAEKYEGPPMKFLIDQGSADEFLADLHTEDFLKACENSQKISVIYHKRDDYDHHYFFVKTFIEDHIKYHVQCLSKL